MTEEGRPQLINSSRLDCSQDSAKGVRANSLYYRGRETLLRGMTIWNTRSQAFLKLHLNGKQSPDSSSGLTIRWHRTRLVLASMGKNWMDETNRSGRWSQTLFQPVSWFFFSSSKQRQRNMAMSFSCCQSAFRKCQNVVSGLEMTLVKGQMARYEKLIYGRK